MPNRSIRDDMQRNPVQRQQPARAPQVAAPLARPQPILQPPVQPAIQPMARLPQQSPPIMNPAIGPQMGPSTGTMSPALTNPAVMAAPQPGGIIPPAAAPGGIAGNMTAMPAPAPVLSASPPSPAARPPVQAIGNPQMRQGGVIGQPMIGTQVRPPPAPMAVPGATGPGTVGAPVGAPPPMSGVGPLPGGPMMRR
jgi:hypothetical protein